MKTQSTQQMRTGPQKNFFRLLSDTGFTAAGQTEVILPHRKQLKMECCGRAEIRLNTVRPEQASCKVISSVNQFSFFCIDWGFFFF